MADYAFNMPCGIPGSVSRPANATLEPGFVGKSPIVIGAPVKLVAGEFAPLVGGETGADIYGFLVRRYPAVTLADESGQALAVAGSQQDVLRRGYITVRLKTGSAVKGGPVYIRVSADGAKILGDVEAAAGDGLFAIAAIFMGAADQNGNVEIAYNI